MSVITVLHRPHSLYSRSLLITYCICIIVDLLIHLLIDTFPFCTLILWVCFLFCQLVYGHEFKPPPIGLLFPPAASFSLITRELLTRYCSWRRVVVSCLSTMPLWTWTTFLSAFSTASLDVLVASRSWLLEVVLYADLGARFFFRILVAFKYAPTTGATAMYGSSLFNF